MAILRRGGGHHHRGLSDPSFISWYRICEQVSLNRMFGHTINKFLLFGSLILWGHFLFLFTILELIKSSNRDLRGHFSFLTKGRMVAGWVLAKIADLLYLRTVRCLFSALQWSSIVTESGRGEAAFTRSVKRLSGTLTFCCSILNVVNIQCGF
jgi:hypothetical protein